MNRRRMMMENQLNGIKVIKSITSTGTQYIDTGIIPNADFTYEMELEDTNMTNFENYFGVGSSEMRVLRSGTNQIKRIIFDYFGEIRPDNEFDIITKIKVEKNKIYINDNFITEKTVTTTRPFTKSLLIFQARYLNNLDVYGIFKLYKFKVWNENNDMVLNLIPVLDNNNIPCLYDTLSKKYFYNSGTGQFEYEILS